MTFRACHPARQHEDHRFEPTGLERDGHLLFRCARCGARAWHAPSLVSWILGAYPQLVSRVTK